MKANKLLVIFASLLITACQGVSQPTCEQDPTLEECTKDLGTPAPENLQAVAIDQTSIKLTWTNPPLTTDFQVELQMKSSSMTGFALLKKVSNDVTEYDVSHLQMGTGYTFRARVIDTALSDYSSEVSTTTTGDIASHLPKPTLSISLTAPGVVTVSKSWSNSSSNYVAGIEYENMPEEVYTWNTVATYTNNSTFNQNFTHTPGPGANYYKIKVIYTDGSFYAAESNLVLGKLMAPANLTGAEVDIFGTLKHKLDWTYGTSPAAHNGYQITVEYINQSFVPSNTSATISNAGVKTHTMLPDCAPGTDVKYRVRATSGNAMINASNVTDQLIMTCPN